MNYFRAASPNAVNNYLQLISRGYTVDPNTGRAGSNYRGTSGGLLGAGPQGYRGRLDPIAAQTAIQQFQSGNMPDFNAQAQAEHAQQNAASQEEANRQFTAGVAGRMASQQAALTHGASAQPGYGAPAQGPVVFGSGSSPSQFAASQGTRIYGAPPPAASTPVPPPSSLPRSTWNNPATNLPAGFNPVQPALGSAVNTQPGAMIGRNRYGAGLPGIVRP